MRITVILLAVFLHACGGGTPEVPDQPPHAPEPPMTETPSLCDESKIAARDIAGTCRAPSPTMGALEAVL